MRPLARLAQQIDAAPADHLLAEVEKGGQDLLEVHHPRPASVERQHGDAERRLQRREAEQLVEHDFRVALALDLDDDADAVSVAFVPQIGDALDALVAHRLGDDLDHARLVYLVRDLVDDDGRPILADVLDPRARPHQHRAAAGLVGGEDALLSKNDGAGRKVRTRHVFLDDLADRKAGVVDQRATGIDHLAEIVRRDVGRHADGDAAGAVDQHVRKARRQHHRLLRAFVVVRLEIDGVLVDIVDQRVPGARQPRLRIPHCRRPVAVHRAEVTLALDQRQPHREVLGHPHQRVVDRLIAVRMILTHDVADDARRLAERLIVRVAALVHGEDDPPMHRLQPVPDVGEGARDDHAHRVVEVGALHLVLDVDETEIGAGRHGGRSGQGRALAAAEDDAGAKEQFSTRGPCAQSEAVASLVCEKRRCATAPADSRSRCARDSELVAAHCATAPRGGIAPDRS